MTRVDPNMITYTRVANDILDMICELTATELRVLLIIARHSTGRERLACRLSWRGMAAHTGSALASVQTAAASLRRRGLITIDADPVTGATIWQLVTDYRPDRNGDPQTKARDMGGQQLDI
jgi:hypothetical protein